MPYRRILCVMVIAGLLTICGCGGENNEISTAETTAEATGATTATETASTAVSSTAATETSAETKAHTTTTTAQTTKPSAVKTAEPEQPTPAPSPSVGTEQSGDIPSVPLTLTRNEFPKIDGSTATIPLSIMLARSILGMSQAEAENIISHTKTTQSFFGLVYEESDILLVYEPPDSLFDDLKNNYDIDKSFFEITPIGRDALVFLVNDKNPVKSLSYKQILDIYTGVTTVWSGITGAPAGSAEDDRIVAFQRVGTSGSQVMMENLVMRGKKIAEAPKDLVVSEMEGLIEGIAEYNNSGNALGYSVYYYFNNMYSLEGVRALDVGGIPCTNETIREGAYPFTQDFYAVIRRSEPVNSGARKMFDFLTGSEGALIIEAAGYVSIAGNAKAPGESLISGLYNEGSADTFLAKRDAAADNAPVDITGGKQNLFPLKLGKKWAFFDGNGEMAIEPVFDSASPVTVFNGQNYVQNNGWNGPIYYEAGIRKRDGGETADPYINEYVALIGPIGGKSDGILYETREAGVNIDSINLADGSVTGYRGDEGEKTQFVLFADGREVAMEYGESISYEIYGGDRRLLTKGKNYFCLLADVYGERVSDAEYGEFVEYGNGVFIFKKNNRLIAVDKNGGVIHEFPADVAYVRWYESANMFTYRTTELTWVNDYSYTFSGLMDSGFNKITGADWNGIYPSAGGQTYIVEDVSVSDEFGGRAPAYIVDGEGKKLTQRDYYWIYNTTYDYPQYSGAAYGEPRRPEYFQAQYGVQNDGGYMDYVTDVIDEYGKILFFDTENISVEFIYADYACIRLKDSAKSNYNAAGLIRITDAAKLTAEISGVDDIPAYAESVAGLRASGKAVKNIFSGLLSGVSPEQGVWLLPPVYDYIWPDTGSGYISAGVYPGIMTSQLIAGYSRAVYDTLNDKIAFTGVFRGLSFNGYDRPEVMEDVGTTSAVRGYFYAETSTRKGLLNDAGEWVASVSIFDTLGMDE